MADITPVQMDMLKACAATRHPGANQAIKIGIAVMPFYGAYKGWKMGSGLLGGLLWAVGGYLAFGLASGIGGATAAYLVNKDCLTETGIMR